MEGAIIFAVIINLIIFFCFAFTILTQQKTIKEQRGAIKQIIENLRGVEQLLKNQRG